MAQLVPFLLRKLWCKLASLWCNAVYFPEFKCSQHFSVFHCVLLAWSAHRKLALGHAVTAVALSASFLSAFLPLMGTVAMHSLINHRRAFWSRDLTIHPASWATATFYCHLFIRDLCVFPLMDLQTGCQFTQQC